MNELISKTMGTSLGGRGHRFTCGELMALGDWIMTGMIETADEGEDGNHV